MGGQPTNPLVEFKSYFIKNAYFKQVMSVPPLDSDVPNGGQMLIEKPGAVFDENQLFNFVGQFDYSSKLYYYEIVNSDHNLCLTIDESGIFKNNDNVPSRNAIILPTIRNLYCK